MRDLYYIIHITQEICYCSVLAMNKREAQRSKRVCPGHYAAAAKSLQSCPILCDPIDGSPPGSTVPGILQARTLEWVAIPFSNV